jgi:hypothetical protein
VKAGPDNGPAQPDSLNAGLAKSPGPDCPVACCLRSWFGDWNRAHLLAFAAAAAGVALVLFTSFFTNWSGPLDSIRTYLPWLRRAGGHSPHIHPWYFYLERLAWFHPKKSPVWSEGLILALAGVGCLAAVLRWRMAGANLALARFLALFTVILTAIYAAIAYKTPWCLLGFWHGMILLAGLGAAVLFDWCRRWWARVLLMVILAVAVGHLGWQCWRANFKFAADRRNPYVYSQTVPDLLRLVQTVTGIAKVHPQGFGMPVIVAAPSHEYWPLPWYLRQFKQTGWWGQVPAGQSAPAMVISAAFQAELDEKSNKAWLMVGLFELRPQVFFECYVQFEWWKKYVDTLPKERE